MADTPEHLQQVREQLLKEYMQALKARGVLQDLPPLLAKFKENLFRLWRVSPVEEWPEVKGRMAMLEEFEGMLNQLNQTINLTKEELDAIEKKIGA